MLNVNDDMDEFIKKAAEDYPLKTGKGDWDKIAAGLSVPAVPPTGSKYKRFLWLLLPLLIIGGLPIYYHNIITGVATHSIAANKNIQKQKQKSTEDKFSVAGNKSNSSIIKSNSSIVKEQATTNTAAQHRLYNTDKTKNQLNIAGTVTDTAAINTNNRNNKQKQVTTENASALYRNDIAETKERTASPLTNNKASVWAADSIIHKPFDGKIADNTAAVTKTDTVKKSPAADSSALTKKISNNKSSPIKKTGLYAGLATSLDATTVKFHSIKNVGYDFSLIAGYRFNNHWSLESGIKWDAKKYYSTGKYFDKSKTDLSADYNIHFLNGTCKMFELPLNVKYDFKSKKRSGFYAAAGLSSYIMKKENYTYFTTHFSEPDAPGYYGQRDYKNSTKNWFSVADISGGYQFIFKNNSIIRIEPYFKIPLKGLGVGKLPFTSTGISAAYTLPLH